MTSLRPIGRNAGSSSIRTLVGLAVVGSAAVILITLAAWPKPAASAELRVDRAIELYGSGDRAGAQAVADELVRHDPNEARGWLLQGMLAEDRKDLAAAEHAYTRSLALLGRDDARHTDVEVTLADLLRRKGNPEDALKALEKVARERGESGRIHHARVLAFIDLRRFEDALSETRLLAEERCGGGVAKKLESQIRSLMDAQKPRDG
jgi:Flp pilus assembly protein TadD